MERGRNCKGMESTSQHQVKRGGNHKRSGRRQFLRAYSDIILRGDNRFAPERIRVAHGRLVQIIHKEYLVASNEPRCIPTHRARLSELLLLNRVMKSILHVDAWYLPENPEFAYKCIISIQDSRMGVQIVRGHYEFRGRRIL